MHARTVAAAKYRNQSLNTLIQEALDRYVAKQEERHLYDAFTELGSDSEMSDISFAKAERILTADKDRILGRIGQITETDMRRVETALKKAQGMR